jgi:hypothetical protein
MEFRMHESGLHYFEPGNKAFTFLNTVAGNKEGYTKGQLKGAKEARALYSTLEFPQSKISSG